MENVKPIRHTRVAARRLSKPKTVEAAEQPMELETELIPALEDCLNPRLWRQQNSPWSL